MERALSRGKLSNNSHLGSLSDENPVPISLRLLWITLWITLDTCVTWEFEAEVWAARRR